MEMRDTICGLRIELDETVPADCVRMNAASLHSLRQIMFEREVKGPVVIISDAEGNIINSKGNA